MPTNHTLRQRPANKPTLFKVGGFWRCDSWFLGARASGLGMTPKEAYRAWFECL